MQWARKYSLCNKFIGGGAYWAGRAVARPLFGPYGQALSLALPLFGSAKKYMKVIFLCLLREATHHNL